MPRSLSDPVFATLVDWLRSDLFVCRLRPLSILLTAGLAACSTGPTTPEFPVRLPESLDASAGPIAIVGDLQITPRFVRTVMRRENNGPEQVTLIDDMARRRNDISALVILGDLVFTGHSRSDWKHFDGLLAPIAAEVPILPAIGNHDYRCFLVRICTQRVVPERFRSRFRWFEPGRAYWVPYGRLALVFVDSETGLAEQGQWLRERMGRFESEFDGLVLFSHRPPYTNSATRDTYPDERVQEHIVAVLRESPMVSVFFSGHAHGYEHQIVDRMHFIVSAGGGGPRGRLVTYRPHDVYEGRNCAGTSDESPLRPYNYQLLEVQNDEIVVTTLGFCRGDPGMDQIEQFRIPLEKG